MTKSRNERLVVFLQEGLMIDCVRNVNIGCRKYESNEDQEARSSLGVIHKSLALVRVRS